MRHPRKGRDDMPRSLTGSSMLSSAYIESEDSDPRIGLVNLADVMLVFACGLMLALVAYWNLDISARQEMLTTKEVSEVTDISQFEEEMLAGTGGGFTELGTVYQDPMTGKLYMLTEDLEKKAEP